MSGGAYDYGYSQIDNLADEIESNPEYASEHNASPELRTKFKEHLKLVAKACRAIEWNDSGDGDDKEVDLIKQCLGLK